MIPAWKQIRAVYFESQTPDMRQRFASTSVVSELSNRRHFCCSFGLCVYNWLRLEYGPIKIRKRKRGTKKKNRSRKLNTRNSSTECNATSKTSDLEFTVIFLHHWASKNRIVIVLTLIKGNIKFICDESLHRARNSYLEGVVCWKKVCNTHLEKVK